MAGGVLYLLFTLIRVATSYWVAKDAGRRAVAARARSLGTFFGSLPALITYFFVRDDIRGGSRRPDGTTDRTPLELDCNR